MYFIFKDSNKISRNTIEYIASSGMAPLTSLCSNLTINFHLIFLSFHCLSSILLCFVPPSNLGPCPAWVNMRKKDPRLDKGKRRNVFREKLWGGNQRTMGLSLVGPPIYQMPLVGTLLLLEMLLLSELQYMPLKEFSAPPKLNTFLCN